MVMRGLLANDFKNSFVGKMAENMARRNPQFAELLRQRQAASSPIPVAPEQQVPQPKRRWVYDKNLGRIVMQQGE